MSRQVYLIVSESKKYYNADSKAFYEKMHLANLFESEKKANAVIVYHNLSNVKIEPITENEFTNQLMISSTNIILSLEVAASYLEQLKFNVPMISGANKSLYVHIKNMCQKLKFISPIFQKCIEQEEDLTLDCKEVYESLYYELAKVDYYDIPVIVKLIKDFNESKK